MLRVLLALDNILCVREFCISHNVAIYCLRFLETAYCFRLPLSAYWITLDCIGLNFHIGYYKRVTICE